VIEKKFLVPTDSLFFKEKSVQNGVFVEVVGEQAGGGSPLWDRFVCKGSVCMGAVEQ
jgi:hypothetical protein